MNKMSEHFNKLNIIFDKMVYVPKRLRNIKLGHQEFNDNYNNLKVHVEELESVQKQDCGGIK